MTNEDISKIRYALELAREFHQHDGKVYAVIEDALRHLPDLPQSPAWQLIETAPKDGKDVLLCDQASGDVVVGYWGRPLGWPPVGDNTWRVRWDEEEFDATLWMPAPATSSVSRPHRSNQGEA